MAQTESDFPIPALSFLTHRNLSYAAALTSFLAAARFLATPDQVLKGHFRAGTGVLYLGIGLNSLFNADVTDPRSQRLIARGKAAASAVIVANLLYSMSRNELKSEAALSAAALTGLFALLWALRGWRTA